MNEQCESTMAAKRRALLVLCATSSGELGGSTMERYLYGYLRTVGRPLALARMESLGMAHAGRSCSWLRLTMTRWRAFGSVCSFGRSLPLA